jgi:hypothetical protein
MKKCLVAFLVLMLIASVSYATMVSTKVTGSTVSFSTISATVNRFGTVVTFNSVTNKIYLTNLSTVADCYVDLRCTDGNGGKGYLTKDSATVLVPAVGRASPNTVVIDFATSNLGFYGKTMDVSSNGGVNGSNQQIYYVATGEVKDL